VAAEAEQQLSLIAGLELQGDLFGAAGCADGRSAEARAEEPRESSALDEAAQRPRQRRQRARPETPEAAAATQPDPADAGHTAGEDDSDLPAWHHHGLVDRRLLPPMLRHYVELKAAHPERLLLYRLGDFFECFFEDAITASRLLELTLTGKEGGKAIGRVPMAGIPHHAAERYCGELVRRGHSVALCDQIEEASARGPAKGELLRREITRVLTPGTVLEEGMLWCWRVPPPAALAIVTGGVPACAGAWPWPM